MNEVPLDLHARIEAEVEFRKNRAPEGVSVLVVMTAAQREAIGFLYGKHGDPIVVAAEALAPEQYPHASLTGRVLYVGIDEFGTDQHEVVLEVR